MALIINWVRERRARTLLRQSQRRIEAQDYPHAIRLATAAIIVQPQSALAYQQRGLCYHRNGQDAEALQDLHHAITLSPNDYRPLLYRAEVHATMGNHAAALNDYETAARLHTPNATFYQTRARSYIALDRVEDAVQDYTTAIELGANTAALYRKRGELYAISANVGAALRDYDQALQRLQPRLHEASQVVVALGDDADDPRVQDLLALLLDEFGSLRVQRGQLHLLQGDLPAALEDFNAVIDKLPASAAQVALAYSGRGRVRARQNDSDAIDDFERAIALAPDRAATYFNLAEFYFQLNRFDNAHAAFKKLAAAAPDNPLAEMGLALSEQALRHKREAQKRWQRLIAQDERFGNVAWLEKEIFPNHPHLMKVAGNLVVRLV